MKPDLRHLPRAAFNRIANGFRASSTNLAIVLVVLLVAGASAFIFNLRGLYLPVFAAVMTWYVVTSRPAAQPNRAASEMTLVSEQIVAIGVASLIFHVALAGFDLRAAWVVTRKFSGDTIWTAAERFGEGLICATLAPLAAMWVRALNVDKTDGVLPDSSAAASGVSGAAGAPDFAAASMVAEAATAIGLNVDQYNVALQQLVAATDAFSNQLLMSSTATATSFDALLNGIDARLTGLTTGMAELTVEMERRIAVLGSTVETLTKSIAGIAQPISESFGAVADEVRSGGRTLQRGLDDAATDVRASGKALADDFRIVAAGFAEHGRAISRILDGVPEAVDKRVVAIGRSADALGQRLTSLEAGLAATEGAAVKLAADLPQVFYAASSGVGVLKSEMADLGRKLGEGAILLQGLQDIIGAVRRFIPADAEPADVPGQPTQ